MPDELMKLVRDGDYYEKNYVGIDEVTLGYYMLRNVDKSTLLEAVLKAYPETVVDHKHWGWYGRWLEANRKGKTSHFTPHTPTERDIVHVFWRNRDDYYARAKEGSRGAFAVTYLPVEAEGTSVSLDHRWDAESKMWVSDFYPDLYADLKKRKLMKQNAI